MTGLSSDTYPFPDAELDRMNDRIARTSTRLQNTIEEANENVEVTNRNFGWLNNVLSNLYDDPFPPATDAEWDEAHMANLQLILYRNGYGYGARSADAFFNFFNLSPASRFACPCGKAKVG